MSRELVIAVPADRWLRRRDSDGRETEFWPVVEFGEPRRAIGLGQSGTWLLGDMRPGDGIVHELDPPDLIGALPLLEVPLPTVIALARQAATDAGVASERVTNALPIRVLIEAALATRANYWVELAIQWLADVPRVEVGSSVIAAAAEDRRLSQRNRHRLLKILPRSQKGNEPSPD